MASSARSNLEVSVLEPGKVVNIVILGDAGVGKTTLVRVFVSDVFIEDPNMRVVEPVHMSESLNFQCPLLIRDTPSTLEDNSSLLAAELEGADVAVLCYAVDQYSSFDHLSDYWLPQIDALKPDLPVLLVATKRDLETLPEGGEANDETYIERIEPLVEQFKCARRGTACSARTAAEDVHKVFNVATHMVMYPTGPLCDDKAEELTPACDIALTRIFRMFDVDRDGALSIGEIGFFQQKTFGLRLAETETQSILDVIREEHPAGVIRAHDGSSCINESGFKQLVLMFIQQGHPETVWSLLKVHGYNNDIELQTPLYAADLPLPDQSFVLNSKGVVFLEDIFAQYSVDHVLGPEQTKDIFRTIHGGAHPFGPDFPFNTRCSPSGALPRDSWLQLWKMVAMVDPESVMGALFGLGFGVHVDMNPRVALDVGRSRRLQSSHSEQRRCFVVGSHGCGKSSLVRHFLNPSILRHHPPKPTTVPTHYVKTPPPPKTVEFKSATNRPSSLVITEFPQDDLVDAMELAVGQCDVMCLVVDPSTVSSIEYFERAMEMVPDLVPTVVIASQHAAQAEGSRRVQDYCDQVKICLANFAPSDHGSISQDIFNSIAGMSCEPTLENPETEVRVARRETRKRTSRIIGVTVALVGLVGLYFASDGIKKHGRSLWSRLRTGLSGGGGGGGGSAKPSPA